MRRAGPLPRPEISVVIPRLPNGQTLRLDDPGRAARGRSSPLRRRRHCCGDASGGRRTTSRQTRRFPRRREPRLACSCSCCSRAFPFRCCVRAGLHAPRAADEVDARVVPSIVNPLPVIGRTASTTLPVPVSMRSTVAESAPGRSGTPNAAEKTAALHSCSLTLQRSSTTASLGCDLRSTSSVHRPSPARFRRCRRADAIA